VTSIGLVAPWSPPRQPGRVWSGLRLALLVLAAVTVAVGLGGAAAFFPAFVLAGVVCALVVVVVWRRPEMATYLAIALTPLLVGIDRDRLVPVLRPNEALLGLLIGVLVLRAIMQMRPGARPSLRLGPVATSLLLFAFASSVLPLLFMVLRGRTVEMDDITYAAVLWKLLALYTVVRYTIHTERQVRICLWISMLVAALVGAIAILQSLDLLGVRGFLMTWYAPFGYTAGFADPRAGSTVGLPAATADLMIFNLVIAVGCGLLNRRHVWLLASMSVVFVLAVFSAAEFSSVLGLLVAGAVVTARLRWYALVKYGVLLLPVAVILLWPTVEHRITEFQSLHGLPTSWLVRWYNLATYFWPEIFDGSNFLLGVRPAARVEIYQGAFGYVWIESGYTWLLWGGGVALFAAFCWFVWVVFRVLGPRCAESTSLAVIVVLMNFDPHITYRGSSDAFVVLLALSLTGQTQLSPAGGADHGGSHRDQYSTT
jgi:hypothetical protein